MYKDKKSKNELVNYLPDIFTVFSCAVFLVAASFTRIDFFVSIILALPFAKLIYRLSGKGIYLITSTKRNNGFSEYIPEDKKTLCAMYTILSMENAEKVLRRLEDAMLNNRDSSLKFALVCELEASSFFESGDDEDIINFAEKRIQALNLRYGEKFYLYVIGRSYNSKRKIYIPERNIVKITHELISYIKNDKDEFIRKYDSSHFIHRVKYLFMFDDKTELSYRCVQKLFYCISSDENRVSIDNGQIIRGSALIYPSLVTKNKEYSAEFCGIGMINADVYWHLLKGKEIYDPLYLSFLLSGTLLKNIKFRYKKSFLPDIKYFYRDNVKRSKNIRYDYQIILKKLSSLTPLFAAFALFAACSYNNINSFIVIMIAVCYSFSRRSLRDVVSSIFYLPCDVLYGLGILKVSPYRKEHSDDYSFIMFIICTMFGGTLFFISSSAVMKIFALLYIAFPLANFIFNKNCDNNFKHDDIDEDLKRLIADIPDVISDNAEFYLLAFDCAREYGVIDTQKLCSILEKFIPTIIDKNYYKSSLVVFYGAGRGILEYAYENTDLCNIAGVLNSLKEKEYFFDPYRSKYRLSLLYSLAENKPIRFDMQKLNDKSIEIPAKVFICDKVLYEFWQKPGRLYRELTKRLCKIPDYRAFLYLLESGITVVKTDNKEIP